MTIIEYALGTASALILGSLVGFLAGRAEHRTGPTSAINSAWYEGFQYALDQLTPEREKDGKFTSKKVRRK